MGHPAVLSVDLECFSHLPAYRGARGRLDDPDVGLSAVDGLLDRFGAHGASSTFFVVSGIAERHPELVARIAEAGHEVASHTRRHVHLSSVSSAERREELARSRETLERTAGVDVAGFRAPSFDVPSGPEHFAALDAAGYGYDSSVVPCRSIPGWYGGEYTQRRPCRADRLVDGAPASVAELPVAVMPGLRLPLSGTWLRFFGVRYAIAGMRLLARRGIAPVLYVHPWEFVDLPAVDGVPRRVYWRTGAWMRRALERLLEQPFAFVTARSVLRGVTDA
jgi:peptidoglycan/xylan/chitin deacetylase (PgdA/CDA1 family)